MSTIKSYWDTYKQTIFRILPLILLVVFMLLYVESCTDGAKAEKTYENNLVAMNSKQYNLNLKNGELATQKAILVSTEKQLRQQIYMKDDTIKVLLEKIKNPVAVIKWKTRTVFDTVFFPYAEGPLEMDFVRTFNKQHPWYSISGEVNKFGVKLNSPSFPNEQRLVVGYVKGRATATITNSNPFIVTENLEGQVIEMPKKHWVVSLGGGWNPVHGWYFGPFFGFKLTEF